MVIRVEGISEIRTAFGPEVADDITGACRQAVRRYTITDNKLVITPQDASEGWRVTYQRVPG